MKKNFIFICLFLFISFVFYGCNSTNSSSNTTKDSNKLTIAVSIVPEKTFVEKVAGDLVNIVTLIPPGKSPSNYEPNPEVLENLSDSSLYFSIGVPTENATILPKIKEFKGDIKIINLANQVSKVYTDRYFSQNSKDPHIWMSPKRVKIIISSIKNELCTLDPKHKNVYSQNAKKYIDELTNVDNKLKTTLSKISGKSFIVYHPSFGYFAEDYGLKMISLEKNGKQATPKEMTKLIDIAKKENIKVIFYQAELDSKQAKAFAESINGKAEKIDALSSDYINNLQKISNTFLKTLK